MMQAGKYVVFKLGKESYGISIANVERILPSQEVTKVPRANKIVKGMFELRDSCLVVLDGYSRLNLSSKVDATKNFIVVLNETGRCALSVESVEGIFNFDENNIEPPATTLGTDDAFIGAIGKNDGRLVVLLDAAHIAPPSLAKKLAQAA